MDLSKIIWVVGIPSGGTSMVAGTLHHLGVNMGNVETLAEVESPDRKRKYLGYECRDLIGIMNGLKKPTEYEVFLKAFHNYILLRRTKSNGQPFGIKSNHFNILGMKDIVLDLPIQVVFVNRDLKATFMDDIKYRGEDYTRAAWMGQLHLAFEFFKKRAFKNSSFPAFEIDYEESLKNPKVVVKYLIGCLNLNPTCQQFNQAVEFIDPVKCQVLVKEPCALPV